MIDLGYCIEFYDGPTGKRGSSPKEHVVQVDAIAHTRYHHPGKIVFHAVNEGDIKVQYRQKLIEAGMLAGIPDVLILYPSGIWHGAAIELKRENKSDSKVSDNQKQVLQDLRDAGYFTALAWGFEQYKKALQYYFK